jgi:tetratricopeptide (TPR) repeat protein
MLDNVDSEQDLTNNEDSYEGLISSIEIGQGMLLLLIASCDSSKFQDELIDRYEIELAPSIPSYRVKLDRSQPSLRAALEQLVNDRSELNQPQAPAVIQVTGAANLLSISLSESETNSALDRFFGYLQITREGLREFPYPIVLWVTPKILSRLSVKAPDFWSWRGGVFRFIAPLVTENVSQDDRIHLQPIVSDISTDLPLDELLEQIARIEQQNPSSLALATLFDRVGQAYSNRSKDNDEENLEKANEYFERSINLQATLNSVGSIDTLNTLIRSGNLDRDRKNYQQAELSYQKALTLARKIGDLFNEARSLNNLGNVYLSWQIQDEAIDYYEKSLIIYRELKDRESEARTLSDLGKIFHQRDQAIDYYQQSLIIYRELNDRQQEALTLENLGYSFSLQNRWDEVTECYQQSLIIYQELKDRQQEALTLGKLAYSFSSQDRWDKVTECYQQSLIIYRELNDRQQEALVLDNLGNCAGRLEHQADYYRRDDRWKDAIDYYRRSLIVYRELGYLSNRLLDKLEDLAEELNDLEKWDEAIDCYQLILMIHQELDNDPDSAADTLIEMGLLYKKRGQIDRATVLLQAALSNFAADTKEYKRIQRCLNDIQVRE